VNYLEEDAIHAARLLADYGDPAAVSALVLEFDRTPTDGPDADSLTLVTVASAILALGGGLDPPRRARFDASRDVVGGDFVAQRRRRIEGNGFNDLMPLPDPRDPCPCGSGAAYEACCASIEAELAERHRLWSLWPLRR
jgi:hypothetical protein